MRRELFSLAAAAALAGSLVTAAAATADTTAPSWNCRASVARISSPLPTFEPLAANAGSTPGGDAPQCAPDYEGAPAIGGGDPASGEVSIQAPYSMTNVTPAIGAARDQTAGAGTKAADVKVSLGGGSLEITAMALRSQATAKCVSGKATFPDTSSSVANLKINGMPVVTDDQLLQVTQLFDGSPLDMLVKVKLNDHQETPTGVVQQAARIELFSFTGTPQGTIVLGEAKASAQGDTCAPATPGGGPNPPGGTDTNTNTNTTSNTNQSTANGPSPISGSGFGRARPIVINGRNGGCGRVGMWFAKVAQRGSTKGHPRAATSRFGNRVVLRGTLRSCSGKAITGARLDVIHRFGGRTLTKTGLKSRSGGKLTLILPMNLASRTITIAYRGDLAKGKITSRRTLRLTVRDRHGRILKAPPKKSLA
jgi:hypothetical protein